MPVPVITERGTELAESEQKPAPVETEQPAITMPAERKRIDSESTKSPVQSDAVFAPATLITSDDVYLNRFTVADMVQNYDLIANITYQSMQGPLYAKSNELAKKQCVVLHKGTGLAILKQQIGNDEFLCDYVKVMSGSNKGLEGWIVDRYVIRGVPVETPAVPVSLRPANHGPEAPILPSAAVRVVRQPHLNQGSPPEGSIKVPTSSAGDLLTNASVPVRRHSVTSFAEAGARLAKMSKGLQWQLAQNDMAVYRSVFGEAQTVVGKFIGYRVTWEATVESVDAASVKVRCGSRFPIIDPMNDKKNWFYLLVRYETDDRSLNRNDYSDTLRIGTQISADYAATLKPGSTVSVSGTVAKFYWRDDRSALVALTDVAESAFSNVGTDSVPSATQGTVSPRDSFSALATNQPEIASTASAASPVRSTEFRAEFAVRDERGGFKPVGIPAEANTLGLAVLKAVRGLPAAEGRHTVRLTVVGRRLSLTVLGNGETLPGAANMAANNAFAKYRPQ